MQHEFLQQYVPKPVPFMDTLKKHGLTVPMVAKYLGVSYSYTFNSLNGIYKMSKPVEKKLKKLVDRLENGEKVNLKRLMPKPTKYKAIFKRHSVKTTMVANYLGKNFPYVSGMISGRTKIPAKIEKQLDDLVAKLEEGR
jgi:hypothetical protein